MCRWFAYLAPTEECLLEDVLITPAHALSKQVHDHYLPNLMSYLPGEATTEMEITVRNRLQNVDGFGVAWYTQARSAFMTDTSGPRPALYKHTSPPTKDPNFHNICANTSTTAVFAHIRAATAGTVTEFNNHPFVFGRHTVMHNGDIANFSAIRRAMLDLMDADAFDNVHGTTDSEHLAALYMTFLTKSNSTSTRDPTNPTKPQWEQTYPLSAMKSALENTIRTIISLQDTHKSSSLHPDEPNSLNVCITDGSQMLALRYRNHPVEQPPSLYYSTTAGVTLNRKYPDHPDGPNAAAAAAAAAGSARSKTPSAPLRTISAPNLNLNPDLSLKQVNSAASFKEPASHGAHVIVASEPTTYKSDEWKLIEKNCVVMVDEKGKMHVEKMNC